MSGLIDWVKKDITITVPVGETIASAPGENFAMKAKHLIVVAPDENAQYRIQIDYDDNFPARLLPDPPGLFTGNIIKDLDVILTGVFTVYVRDATPGTYQIRFVGEKARV